MPGMTPPSVTPLTSAKAVAEWLGCSPRQVTGMAQRGEIPAYRVGGMWRFDRHELGKWLRAQRR